MASSSIVGVLRALLTADTAQFDAAMAGASAKTKAWTQDFTKLGLTAEQVGSVMVNALDRSLASVSRLAKEFSGASLAKTADEYAAAIERIGGASHLTESEQAKVNAVMTEAIEKYRALGQEAPQHLIKLQQETAKTENSAEHLAETLRTAFEHPMEALRGLSGDIGAKLGGALEAIGPAGAVAATALVAVAGAIVLVGKEWLAMAEKAAHAGEEIDDLSNKTGIAIPAMSKLAAAVTAAGGSAQTAGNAIFTMQERMEQAGPAGDKVRSALEAIGISFDEFKKQTPDQQLLMISDGLRAIPPGAERASAAFEIFGRQGRELLPTLVKPLRDLTEESDRLGLTWSEKDAAAAEEFGIKSRLLSQALERIEEHVGNALIPALTAMLTAVEENQGAVQLLGDAVRVTSSLIADWIRQQVLWTGIALQLVPATRDLGRELLSMAANMGKVGEAAKGAAKDTGDLTEEDVRAILAAGKHKDLLAALTAEYNKLTTAQKERIVAEKAAGATTGELAKEYEVQAGVIDRVVKEHEAAISASKRAATEEKKHQDALDALASSQVKVDDVTKAYVLRLHEQKLTEEQIAQTTKDNADVMQLTVTQVKQIIAAKQEQDKIDKESYHFQIEVAKEQKKNLDEIAEREKKAAEKKANALTEEVLATEAAQAKVNEIGMTGLQLELARIDEAERKESDANKKKYDEGSELYKKLDELNRQFYQGERNTAEQRALAASMQRWGQYYGELAQLSGNTLHTQLASVDAWYKNEIAKLTAAQKADADYMAWLAAEMELKKKEIREKFTADWMNVGAQAIQEIGRGFQTGDISGAIGNVAQQISGQLLSGLSSTLKEKAGIALGQAIGQAVGGKNVGEQIGSAIGLGIGLALTAGNPLGAAIGSAAGGAIGGFIDRIHQGHQIGNAIQDIANEMHVKISNALATSIADTAKNLQKMENDLSAATARHYAELLQLEQIIAAQGGLTAKNLAWAADQARRLFEVVKRGGEVGAAATQELNNLLVMFGDEAERSGGLWSDTFKNLINDAKAAGISIEAVTKLIEEQKTKLGGATVGLTISTGTNADQFKTLSKDLQDAKDSLKSLMDEGADTAKIDEAKQKVDDLQKKIGEIPVTSQEEFDRLSRIVLTSFGTLIANGTDAVTAVSQIGPAIDNLIHSADAFGLSGNSAFDALKRWRELVSANEPLLTQVSSLSTLMATLANLGGLTKDAFADLEAQGNSAFEKLTAAGFTEGEALTQMKPLLENIIKLHKDKGFVIDDNTQKLIDEATQQGILDDKQLSTNDILLEGFKAILKALGVDIPDAWKTQTEKQEADAKRQKEALEKVGDAGQQAASDTADAWSRVHINVPVNLDVQNPDVLNGQTVGGSGGPETPSFASGGFVPKRTLAYVGDAPGGELIVPFHQLEGAAQGFAKMLVGLKTPLPDIAGLGGALDVSHGATVGASSAIPPVSLAAAGKAGAGTVVVELDRRFLAQMVVPELEGEVARLGFGRGR